MKKVELNKDVRIKRDENYEVIENIRKVIAWRINAEYRSEIYGIQDEIDGFIKAERQFYQDCKDFFKNVTIADKLKVVVQVGKGSKELFEYTGFLEKPLRFNDTLFNFISKERDNDLKPFTIAFSCLQSVELL